jgi:hypothetical protein
MPRVKIRVGGRHHLVEVELESDRYDLQALEREALALAAKAQDQLGSTELIVKDIEP